MEKRVGAGVWGRWGLPDPGPMWYNMRMSAERPADKEELISLAEAARRYGFSQEYLSLLARKGRLKAVKIARNWLTTPANVEAYIRSRKRRGKYRDDIEA